MLLALLDVTQLGAQWGPRRIVERRFVRKICVTPLELSGLNFQILNQTVADHGRQRIVVITLDGFHVSLKRDTSLFGLYEALVQSVDPITHHRVFVVERKFHYATRTS